MFHRRIVYCDYNVKIDIRENIQVDSRSCHEKTRFMTKLVIIKQNLPIHKVW